MSAMETHVKVGGTDLKDRIEKVFATEELRAALNYMVEMLSEEGSAFPCWMEGVIADCSTFCS
jgi:methionine synthase I (cobalamin-dependent)